MSFDLFLLCLALAGEMFFLGSIAWIAEKVQQRKRRARYMLDNKTFSL